MPIADINVTPFINVMLVLLIIFMVTAPLMLGGVHIIPIDRDLDCSTFLRHSRCKQQE